MGLADVVRKATSKIVPKTVIGLAKSTVTTTRMVKTRDAAARTVNTPTHPITDGRWFIVEVADAHVQRVWGINANVTAEATLPLTTDVKEDDVVKVTAGDLAGDVFEVDQIRRDYNGNVMSVALGPTGQTP
jgi:hypothetical protein